MNAKEAAAAGLPCLVGNCAAEDARSRLASGKFDPLEREHIEREAKGCLGPQPDPFGDPLTWDGCPAKAAFAHRDIADALTVREMAAVAQLSDWPHGYAARVADTWIAIERERAIFDAERSA